MATRRTSARLSGGSDGGVVVHQELEFGRKRVGDQISGGGEKRRKSVKKQREPLGKLNNSGNTNSKAAFTPQPVSMGHSSNTPEEDDDDPTHSLSMSLPPPPSEKKIARRRESTKAIRERDRETSPAPPPKRPKTTSTTSHHSASSSSAHPKSSRQASDPLLDALRQDAPPIHKAGPIHVDFLKRAVTSSKHAAPRPSSPPRALPRQSVGASSTMGPPTEFVRKTRKSMVGNGYGDLAREAVVPLPEADTPMINKNRDMREAQQRRSSLGLRGQRASSSLGKGEISIPHTGVESETFWKHISPAMPEPIRARHLLVYCAKRATDEHMASSSSSKGKSKSSKEPDRTAEGDRLVQEIMDDFMSTLGKGFIDTNVFSQLLSSHPAGQISAELQGSAPKGSGIPLKAHPKNVANRDAEQRENNLIKQCKAESTQWNMLVHRTNKRQQSLVPRLREKSSVNAQSGSRPETSTAPEWLRIASNTAEEILDAGEGDLMSSGEFEDVEYKVDLLHSTSHAAAQYSLHASRFLDGIFNALSTDLRNRGAPSMRTDDPTPDVSSVLSQAANAASGSGTSAAGPSAPRPTATDPMSMLRALAAADAKDGSSAEVEEAASRVAPISLASASGMSAAMTPRRVGVTPRRPGTTPAAPGAGIGVGVTPKSVGTRVWE